MSKQLNQRPSLKRLKRKGSSDSKDFDEIQRVWTAEAIRRRDEIRSSQVKTIPGEEVLSEVRRLVGRN